MTPFQKFARIFGLIYAAVGILGFFPILVQPIADTTGLDVVAGYGRLLGIFPINVTHNLVHLGLGLWGIWAAKTDIASIAFAKTNAVLLAALAVLGFIPATGMLFGLAPIYGIDAVLHAATAIVAGYFGYILPTHIHHDTPAAIHH